MKKRRTLLVLFPLLCLFALAGCEPFFHRQVSGKVLSLEGSAQTSQSTSLTSGSFIKAGQTITTASATRVDLLLVPAVLVELSGKTELAITQLHLERDGNETIHPMTARDATIELRRGALVATVGEAQTEPGLTVKTPVGTVTSGPAQTFELTLAGDHLRIFSVRGDALFRATSGKAVAIPAGYFADFPSANSAPRLAADAGAPEQAQVRKLLAIEKRLLHLQDEKITAYRPW